MVLRVDFNSDEALYMQLRNQIIFGIATGRIREGDSLPSVRQLAEYVSINMHTVNKAYTVLREEGFVKLDRRKGAVVAVDVDQVKAVMELADTLDLVLAQAICKNVAREDVHRLVDQIYDEYGGDRRL